MDRRQSSKPQIMVFFMGMVVVFAMLYAGRVISENASTDHAQASIVVEEPMSSTEFVRAEASLLEQIRAEPDSPALYRALGELYAHVGRYDRAVSIYSQAIALDTTHARTYLLRGIASVGSSALTNAATDFERALGLDPTLTRAVAAEYVNLAHHTQDSRLALGYLTRALELAPSQPMYTERGLVYAALGDLTNASADYEQAVALTDQPSTFAAQFYALGQMAFDSGLFNDALTYFSRAIALEDNEAVYYYMRARTHESLNDVAASATDYEQAALLDASLSPVVLRDLANAAYARSDYPAAVTYYTRLTTANPDDFDAQFGLILSTQSAGNPETAYALFTQMVTRFNTDLEQVRNLAQLAVRLGWQEQVISLYGAVLQVDPSDADAYVQIGYAYMMLGDRTRGLQYAEQGVQIAPNNATLQFSLGRMYFMAGNSEQAQAAFLRAGQLAPANAQIFANLGEVTSVMGETQQAISYYEQALRLDPNLLSARQHLANIYTEDGEYALARAHLEVALSLAPNDATLYQDSARLQALLGDSAGAVAMYQRAIELKPDDPQPYDVLAQYFVSIEDYPNAITYFTFALDHDFNGSDVEGGVYGVVERLAETFNAQGDLINAINYYEYLVNAQVNVNARLSELYRVRGGKFTRDGRTDLAIADYERGFSLNPEDPDIYDSLVRLHFDRGINAYLAQNYDVAIVDLGRLMQLNVTSPEIELSAMLHDAYYQRAQGLEDQGNFQLAIEDYLRASQYQAFAPTVQLHLGDLYYRLGAHEQSLTAYRSYIQLTRSSPPNQ
ncbi:MAG: tetratricopeptide repeat protein [Aggregatilineales bacterium]